MENTLKNMMIEIAELKTRKAKETTNMFTKEPYINCSKCISILISYKEEIKELLSDERIKDEDMKVMYLIYLLINIMRDTEK